MGIELSGAGEALTAIVVSDELSKQHTQHSDDQDANAHKNCANCGAQLTGAFCHACGQSAHIHRSLLHMVEEALHGIFHFDTKAWRTIPALIFKPGHLTKQYIEGKRTSFVSPLALFLFLIFLMFFIFSYTMTGPSNDMLHIPSSREDIVKELSKAEAKLKQQLAEQAKQGSLSSGAFELQDEINDLQFEIRKFKDTLSKLDGKEKDLPALRKELELAETNLQALKAAKMKFKLAAKKGASGDIASNENGNAESNVITSSESGSETSSTKDNSKKQLKQLGDATTLRSTSEASPSTSIPIAKLQPWEVNQSITAAERQVKYLKKQIAAGERAQASEQEKAQQKTAVKKIEIGASSSADASANTTLGADNSTDEQANDEVDIPNINIKNSSSIPYFKDLADHAMKNPELTLFKMKKNASGLAFLLMPLTLPFIWLLFAFKRKFVMFDHAVFSLYSLSFMCLLLSTIAILTKFEFNTIAALLFAFVPPIHMFAQLRHAYSLGIFATFWRTIALLFIAILSLSLFATIVTIASA
ncbi:DUF3667 domain-containing protein [Undibacterium danionis]|uniref:DUF3667 domain-containing protein n=1 Tax=Undibacterium danionis TaxID=1812100 RepID=A0ABV6ICC1_9BURK